MIKTFKHKDLEKLFYSGITSGFQKRHLDKLNLILAHLHSAEAPIDMDLPGLRFHKLKGNLKDNYSLTVNRNWRLTFRMTSKNVYDVNYEDYH